MKRSYRFFALVAVLLSVAACGERGHWPEGMEPIHWDRDACDHCGMAISDPRFAVELRVGKQKKGVFKFDDIGCLVAWVNVLGKKTGAPFQWGEPDVRIWVADFNSPVENREALRWLDARAARYIERSSPMGHNLAAVENADEPSVGFDEVLQRGQAHQHGGGGHGSHR